MATKKTKATEPKAKKTAKNKDSITLEMPGTIGSAKLVFAEPKIVKGSHLTVTTYPDGKTTLEWDDEALMRDVRAAILKAESNIPADMKPNVKAKVVTRKKKEAAMITASTKSKTK
jgi:hypothetical protein